MNLHLPSNYQDPVPTLDLLLICAHPGDAEQTAGGTLVKLAELGYRTGVLDLTPGDVTRSQKTEAMFDRATAAAAPLLLTWRGNLHYPDGRVENSLPGRMTVAGEVRRLRPRLVIVPYWQAQHPDHPATCEMAEQACELAGLQGLDFALGIEDQHGWQAIDAQDFAGVILHIAHDRHGQVVLLE